MIANFTNAANGKKSMEEKKKEVLAYLEKEREWVDYAILNKAFPFEVHPVALHLQIEGKIYMKFSKRTDRGTRCYRYKPNDLNTEPLIPFG